MKNWKLIPFFVCLTLFLCVTAFAGDTVSVTLTTPNGTPSERALVCPESASLWYASYDASGVMLEVGELAVQDGKAALTLSRDAETVKTFALDDNLAPLSPAAFLKGGSPYQRGQDLLASGDYAGAVAAFTEAIAANDDAAASYTGRADAYIASGETAENLTAAKTDYEAALALDNTLSEAYLGVADVYIRQSHYEQAKSVLQDALDKASDKTALEAKIQEIESGNVKDSSGKKRRKSTYGADGVLMWRHDYEYDEQGRQSSVTAYDSNGNQIGRVDLEYDANGNQLVTYAEYSDGRLIPTVNEYDERGNLVKQDEYEDGKLERQSVYQYNEQNQCVRREMYRNYDFGIRMIEYWTIEYDEAGRETKANIYSPEGNLRGYQTRAYDANGKLSEYCSYYDDDHDGVMALTYRYVCEYDENGKMIRMTNYDGEGNVTRVTEYT